MRNCISQLIVLVNFAVLSAFSVPHPVVAQGKKAGPSLAATAKAPVWIGFDGEFSLEKSLSAQSIELGIRAAIQEINAAGGVLGGRPLKLATKDNRANPARGVANLKAFAKIPDLVAVIGGRFSPVVVEMVTPARELGVPLMAAWSSAQDIVDNGHSPNWVFRLALYDRIAMSAMIERAKAKGWTRLGLLLENTTWGRSNMASAEGHIAATGGAAFVGAEWYNWGETTLAERYNRLRRQGAQAILLVANERDGAIAVNHVVDLPVEQRLPIISHWGITGGNFYEQVGQKRMERVQLDVLQTFSLFRADPAKVARVLALTRTLSGISDPEQIEAPVGFGHAYDLTHILARAVNLAGTTQRAKVRAALEQVTDHDGLVKHYVRPFTPDRHEALDAGDLFFARYDRKAVLRSTD